MISVGFANRFDSGSGEGGSEVVAYDAATQRLFVTNGEEDRIDVLDFADPTNITKLAEIDLASLVPNFGGVQSVAAKNGIVAAAVENSNVANDGFVAFFDAATGNLLNTVSVGNLPDMVTFTPDGNSVLVANEGEPIDATTDPQGSVSIIDISGGIASATVTQADFTGFDGQEDALRAQGVRIFSGKSVSEDVEPEYIAVSADGSTAYISLQEANAVGVLDLSANQITDIIPLGTKDHSQPGNELDPSNRDSGIEIANHPVQGFFMPDAIATYDANGSTYIVTANEGDSRDYDFFSEEVRIADLTLDPAAFPNAAALQDDAVLGRLKTTTENGDTDGDGDFDQLFSYGARSFSIFDTSGNLVFDSGAEFENTIFDLLPTLHNSQNFDFGEFDGRSDDKGPEPEGVTVGQIGGSTYAFIGLERVGGVMVYNVTDPANSSFVDYIVPDGADVSPEVLSFIDASDSPTGDAMLLSANEISGTTSAYTVADVAPGEAAFTLQILHASDLEGGVDAIGRAANFAAIEEFLEGQVTNSITLSAGDNYIPGPFFSAAADRATFRDDGVFNDAYNELFGTTEYDSLREGNGRVDISIMNAIGFDASALGNHEFDAGTSTIADIIGSDFRDPDGPGGDRWVGAQFPYLSANLDFTADGALGGLYTSEVRPSGQFANAPDGDAGAPKIAPATIVIENGEPIGVVGATTQLLESISSPGDVDVINGGANDMQALADILNPIIADMTAMGVNKIVTVSHLQQLALEEELAGLLSGVDVMIAGGSDTLLADSPDTLRPGDTADRGYPVITQNADGNDVAIVSTDGEYSYVGRLVVDFDAAGNLIASSVDENISGAFATTDEQVADLFGSADPFAAGTDAAVVDDLVTAVEEVVTVKDSNVLGFTDVYIDGRRSEVRTEETNMGDLTADANLAYAQAVDPTVEVSIKNGGGIRAEIGTVDGITGELLPPQANPLSGKPEGGISQLDIENSLRFNNGLTTLDLTEAELVEVLEHGVAASGPGNTPGQFPQLAGVNFTYSTDLPAGSRIIDASLENGGTLVQSGVFVGDPNADVRIVTLDFLAGGGDNYPFPALGENVVDLDTVVTDAGTSNFAPAGTEQDAIAEFLQANHGDAASAFGLAETDPGNDPRFNEVGRSVGTDQDDTIDGTDQDDTFLPGAGADQMTLGGGADTVAGTVAELDGDTIADFTDEDRILLTGETVFRDRLTVTEGSAVIDVDQDGDGTSDGSFTLLGDFTSGDFMAVIDRNDTVVTFEDFLPVLEEGQAVDPALVNGVNNQLFLTGNGTKEFNLTLRDAGYAGFDNAVGVYEVDQAGDILDARLLFDNANADKTASTTVSNVEAGHSLGFFIVQDAADWAEGLDAADTFSFVNTSGAPANVGDGPDIHLAVNGAMTDETVFHSYSGNMNEDGLVHALSGVEARGEQIVIGFEDLTGGGDRDYEDVVFVIEPFDSSGLII